MHHGILGMHWGIRRYQNPDGTLTAEGKARYKTDVKFKAKVENYRKKDELASKGIKGLTSSLARKYMRDGMPEEDAINKAKDISKITKTTLIGVGAASVPMIGAAFATMPTYTYALSSWINSYNNYQVTKAGIQQKYAEAQQLIDQRHADMQKWQADFNRNYAEVSDRIAAGQADVQSRIADFNSKYGR